MIVGTDKILDASAFMHTFEDGAISTRQLGHQLTPSTFGGEELRIGPYVSIHASTELAFSGTRMTFRVVDSTFAFTFESLEWRQLGANLPGLSQRFVVAAIYKLFGPLEHPNPSIRPSIITHEPAPRFRALEHQFLRHQSLIDA
jgi:hypothetical protein